MAHIFFAYIRVSTFRQGADGVSLHEQRRAIENYADANRLNIMEWYEEHCSAAKRGRPVFDQVCLGLASPKICYCHKV